MGKTRIQQQSQEELIQEGEKLQKAIEKGAQVKKKKKKGIDEAKLYIQATYNNTIMTLTDMTGNTLAWSSAGAIGFKGTKKSTPFAASKVAEVIAQKALKLGVSRLHIIVKGIGQGRDSALRTIATQGFQILSIGDFTPLPHNGCRPPKPRRV